MDWWTTIVLAIAAIFAFYKYAVRNNDHWKKRGIGFLKPVPFFGNMLETVLKTRSFLDVFLVYLKPNSVP
jgi:type II secretory pathway component PulF